MNLHIRRSIHFEGRSDNGKEDGEIVESIYRRLKTITRSRADSFGPRWNVNLYAISPQYSRLVFVGLHALTTFNDPFPVNTFRETVLSMTFSERSNASPGLYLMACPVGLQMFPAMWASIRTTPESSLLIVHSMRLSRMNSLVLNAICCNRSFTSGWWSKPSTEIPVYGNQEQSAYNGHFESTCYHPLLLFNREGDCLAAKLRPGNVHSADDWEELLLPEIERQQKHGKEVVVRADAAFAKPEIYEALEERGVNYAIRIPANENLERDIAELLPRPVGRPSIRPLVGYKSFLYQAASWRKARRVVAKVEHHQGELFPRVGFIVTSLSLPSRAVVRFYNKRGTAEQWIKEGKQAVKMTRLSCHRFRSNEVRLWLSLIAYNLGNLWRRLALPKKIENWSLTSLQQRLVKTGGRLVKHARYYWLLWPRAI